MGAYNILKSIPTTCAKCRTNVAIAVQFKFGATGQRKYAIGDTLDWGANDIGTSGIARIVADGCADSECTACGYAGDWDFYVFIENDRIVEVVEADGRFDFAASATSYLELR